MFFFMFDNLLKSAVVILAITSFVALLGILLQYSSCMNTADAIHKSDCVSTAITGSIMWVIDEITFPFALIGWIASNVAGILGTILVLGVIWFFFIYQK